MAAVLCAQLAGCAMVDYEQRRWIFMPNSRTWGPGLAAAGHRCCCSCMACTGTCAPAWGMRQLHALGFSVLGIDYRGFGRSSDTMPSETLVAEDARAAWDWLTLTFPESRR